jgi:hypothetical protein
MSTLPIQASWSHRPGLINLDIPHGIFTAHAERDTSHLTVTLSRTEAEHVRAALHELLNNTEGGTA